MNEAKLREELRQWILKNSKVEGIQSLPADTLIFEERIITSVQTFDLINFIEKITDTTLDLSDVEPGSFDSIDAICRTFQKQKLGEKA